MSDNFGLLKARTVKSKACEKFDILNDWKLSYAEDDGTGFEYTSIKDTEMADKPLISQTADKVKVSGQIFCKKPFQITRNMV